MLAACATSEGTGSARAAADATTQAVYADNYDAVISNFDSGLKQQPSRAEVGSLSDTLHSLGNYKGISYVDGDPVKAEYTYRLSFDKGTMALVVRVGQDGHLSAYRLFAQS
ncbi:MAG TPA: hypothetical protein VKS80_14335 [Trinickia sp.]|nr:hypothetical protein [Trinickia sp.]